MKFRIDLKIFIFIILFCITRQIEIYALIMMFAIIHELAHLITGIILKFKPDKLELIPLGLAVSFKINMEDYNVKYKKANLFEIKKIIVALAGPISNILLMFIFYYFDLLHSIKYTIVYANLLIAIFNLLPIYPLDGGRVLKGILHIIFGKWKSKKYINSISLITTAIITVVASIAILYIKNISIFFIVIYLWIIVIREKNYYDKELIIYKVIKTIENNFKK